MNLIPNLLGRHAGRCKAAGLQVERCEAKALDDAALEGVVTVDVGQSVVVGLGLQATAEVSEERECAVQTRRASGSPELVEIAERLVAGDARRGDVHRGALDHITHWPPQPSPTEALPIRHW